MDKFCVRMLRYTFKRVLKQSAVHRKNLVQIQSLLREAIETEFTEDNAPTHRAFAQEAFDSAWEN